MKVFAVLYIMGMVAGSADVTSHVPQEASQEFAMATCVLNAINIENGIKNSPETLKTLEASPDDVSVKCELHNTKPIKQYIPKGEKE